MNHFSWPFPDSEPHFCRRFGLLLPVLQLSHRVFSSFRDAGATKPLSRDLLHEASEKGDLRFVFRWGREPRATFRAKATWVGATTALVYLESVEALLSGDGRSTMR